MSNPMRAIPADRIERLLQLCGKACRDAAIENDERSYELWTAVRRELQDAPEVNAATQESGESRSTLERAQSGQDAGYDPATQGKRGDSSVSRPDTAVAAPREVCPDCGRVKARSADDAMAGLCPKWWAIRDQEAEHDCVRARSDMWRLHARAFDAFLNELYAIMVDPCADGSMRRDDMMQALKDAALRDRERAAVAPTSSASPTNVLISTLTTGWRMLSPTDQEHYAREAAELLKEVRRDALAWAASWIEGSATPSVEGFAKNMAMTFRAEGKVAPNSAIRSSNAAPQEGAGSPAGPAANGEPACAALVSWLRDGAARAHNGEDKRMLLAAANHIAKGKS